MSTLLSIKELSVSFNTLDGKINAIQDVTIDILQGEVVAIVGESGSGKSVTSMSILRLHPADITLYEKGEISFYQNNEVVNLLSCSNDALQQIRGNEIAMIFQEPMTSLNPVMKCGEQIIEAIIQHKKVSKQEATQQALHFFEQVKLPEPKKAFAKYPHELSGGQKQRVMIAMAMCCQPKLLICDEPTTALDVTVQKNILELIKELQKENNMSVIFISHDLGLVKNIADKIVVMYKGAIVEQGKADTIFNNPTHPYTKALLACRPTLYPKGVKLPVVADFMNKAIQEEDKGFQETKKETYTDTATIKNNTEKQMLFSVKNLCVSYPTQRNIWGKVTNEFMAVDNVSFDIFKGETVGLVGESGCGKTTLGRTLLQLQKPKSGTILYNGKDFFSYPKSLLTREIQIIFQDPYSSLNPRITIGDAIKEAIVFNRLRNKADAKGAVIQLLEKVELKAEHYKRYPHEFSGGQRQRIVIARALAMQPKFIVCDESVSALDVSVQAQILNLLNDLKKEFDFTNLFISHDLSVVRYISDRIIVMQKGKLVEVNDADKVFYQPEHDYTKRLIESIPL